MDSPLPLPVERAIQKLGGDISLARRRRYKSAASMLQARAPYFALDETQALAVLRAVHAAVSNWRQIALSLEVGL